MLPRPRPECAPPEPLRKAGRDANRCQGILGTRIGTSSRPGWSLAGVNLRAVLALEFLREAVERLRGREAVSAERCVTSIRFDMRRGGRARLKASDSKSDRGVSPSGVQILSPPPNFTFRAFEGRRAVRRGGRVAEGAALEMPCTGNCTVGSNPTPSAIFAYAGIFAHAGIRFRWAVLDGEVAVPCNPQSATAGLNSPLRAARVE